MSDIVGSDIPQGSEVRWYAGGTLVHETIVATSGQTEVTFSGGATAEYGSVLVTINGALPATITETGSEAAGSTKVTFTAAVLNDTIDVYYIKTTGAALKQVATCQDVKADATANVKSASVHGQAVKLTSVGALENTGDMEEFYYNSDLIGLAMGDVFADAPIAGGYKWTNKFTGSRKIGALVGKRYNSSGVCTYKWFLAGAQTTGLGSTHPTEEFYKKSLKFAVDYWLEADLS